MGGIQHELATVLPDRVACRLFELVPLSNSDEFIVVEQLTEIFKIPIVLNGKLVDEKTFCRWHVHGQ